MSDTDRIALAEQLAKKNDPILRSEFNKIIRDEIARLVLTFDPFTSLDDKQKEKSRIIGEVSRLDTPLARKDAVDFILSKLGPIWPAAEINSSLKMFVASVKPKRVFGNGAFAPTNFSDITDDGEEIGCIVDGLIRDGSLNIVSGHPKTGKSTIIRQLTACVVSGKSFLGFKTVQNNVLYFCLEEHPKHFRKKLVDMGLDADAFGRIWVESSRMGYDGNSIVDIENFVVNNSIGMVVIDTLSRFWNIKDENSAREVDTFISPLLGMTRRTGAAIMMIHHLKKGESSGGMDIRGSGALFASVDASFSFKRHGGESSQQRIISIYSRYDVPPAIVVNYENGLYDIQGVNIVVGEADDNNISLWEKDYYGDY